MALPELLEEVRTQLLDALKKVDETADVPGSRTDGMTTGVDFTILGHNMFVKVFEWQAEEPRWSKNYVIKQTVEPYGAGRRRVFKRNKAGKFNYAAMADMLLAGARARQREAEGKAKQAENGSIHAALIERLNRHAANQWSGVARPSVSPAKPIQLNYSINRAATAAEAELLADFLTALSSLSLQEEK